MRRSERDAIRFGVVIAAVGLVAATLYFTGWGAIVKNVGVLAWRGNSMTALARRTPFTPPAGGVAEERLVAYLAVCDRIKPFGDEIDAWEAAHVVPGQRTAFKAGAAGLVGAYLRELSLALQQQKMGPAEFAWIDDRMRQVKAQASVPESERVLFAKYQDRLAAAALGPHARDIALGFAR
jgi:hypothetical protein